MTTIDAQEDAPDPEVTPDQSGDDAPALGGLDAPTGDAEEVSFDDVVDECVSLARAARATGVTMRAIHYPGGRLPPPLDRYPNGKGGETHYGVSLITDWRDTEEEPVFASPRMSDAIAVFDAMEEQKERTWRQTATRPDLDEDAGGGSSRRSDSSERPTGASGRIRSLAKRHRSRRTS